MAASESVACVAIVCQLDDSMSVADMALMIQHSISTSELLTLIDELCALYEPTDEMIAAGDELWPRAMK